MRSNMSRLAFIAGLLGALHLGGASAAQTGGTVAVSGGAPGPSCQSSRTVSTSTVQDTLSLAVAASCNGGSGTAEIRSDALAPSVGLQGSASDSSASAFVILSDVWTIGVPASVPLGGSFSLPVSFRLEGDVAPGSLYGPAFGRFLDLSGSLGQFGTASGLFQVSSRIDSIGHFDQTFAGLATFTNFGPTATLAMFEISLFMPFLQHGSVDFLNTLAASVALPPGFTVTSGSGAALFAPLAPVAPVPEPETVVLMMAGLLGLGGRRAWLTRVKPSRSGPNVASAATSSA